MTRIQSGPASKDADSSSEIVNDWIAGIGFQPYLWNLWLESNLQR